MLKVIGYDRYFGEDVIQGAREEPTDPHVRQETMHHHDRLALQQDFYQVSNYVREGALETGDSASYGQRQNLLCVCVDPCQKVNV